MALVVCGACRRHVKGADSVCPFCGASMPTTFRPALGGALLLGIGLAVASCSSGDNGAVAAYGPPPCNGPPCDSNQVCVTYTASSTRCEPTQDGGCPAGLISANSCVDPSSKATLTPGCTYPVGTRCVDHSPGDDSIAVCAAVCDGGTECHDGIGIVTCALN
jgi:hypothetical protein